MTRNIPPATIRFLRHAESAANAGLRTASDPEIPLTDLGHRQAADFAATLPRAPGVLLVSPYRRAVETALPIRKRFPEATHAIRNHLYEQANLAPDRYNGLTDRDRAPFARRYWAICDPHWRDGEDAESFTAFMTRVKNELAFLATLAGQDILAVTHGHFINMARLLAQTPHANAATLMARFIPAWNQAPILNATVTTIDLAAFTDTTQQAVA